MRVRARARVRVRSGVPTGHGRASHVVVDVADGHVEQLPDGLVVAGAGVSHGDGVH